MKKVCVVFLSFVLVLLCGCSQIEDLLGTGPKTGEELYSELDRFISNPKSITMEDLPGTFTFTAKILSEPQELTVEGEDRVYQSAWICRNLNSYLLLDVTDLTEYPNEDDIVSVTGTQSGYVYWTEDNKQVDVLDIGVKEIKPYEPTEVEVNTKPEVAVESQQGSGKITFKGAHFTKDSFDRALVLYFDFTNNGSREIAPSMDKLYITLGDEEESLKKTIFSLNEVDGSALFAGKAGIADKTQPGKTIYYYSAYKAKESPDAKELYIRKYDDNFNMTDEIKINVAPSLSEMK